ncbi:hypothetical protein FS935_17760 [Metabacillus litoralis]|uniref:Uncharacterized protein n=1 Tax=Metabacillus litoralis TaxID=152268 RepID=A0A5C6VXL3_9BACI|nr:hypothetical protein [Metabacillus litoralis]TXC89321.1 hypothetical protein FS935_17760 [Metabacillus litoralis]
MQFAVHTIPYTGFAVKNMSVGIEVEIMRTIMFLVVFLFLILLIAQVDAVIYKSYLFVELKRITRLKPGTNFWMVYIFLCIGFLFSIWIGIKEKLDKIRKRS